MGKWEYKVTQHPEMPKQGEAIKPAEISKELQRVADEGWELIESFVPLIHGHGGGGPNSYASNLLLGTYGFLAIWKREGK